MRYLTNNEAWDEVTKEFVESKRRTKVCQESIWLRQFKGFNR